MSQYFLFLKSLCMPVCASTLVSACMCTGLCEYRHTHAKVHTCADQKITLESLPAFCLVLRKGLFCVSEACERPSSSLGSASCLTGGMLATESLYWTWLFMDSRNQTQVTWLGWRMLLPPESSPNPKITLSEWWLLPLSTTLLFWLSRMVFLWLPLDDLPLSYLIELHIP